MYLCKTKEVNNIKTNNMRTIDIKSLLITDANINALRDAKMTQHKINNTFVRFYKNNSDWVEVSAGELGITESHLKNHTLQEVLGAIVTAISIEPCDCGSCNFVRFEII